MSLSTNQLSVLLNTIDFFDYTKLYEPVLHSTITYHQHPHQFRINRFDENTVLLHYKQWSHSKYWLPIPNISFQTTAQPMATSTTEEVLEVSTSLPSSPTQSPQKKKKRKMTRWTTTIGQRLFISQQRATSAEAKQTVATPIPDIPEAELYSSDTETGVFQPETPCINSVPGISWISESPDLTNVAHIAFTECTVLANFDLAEKIIQDVQKTFAAIMPEFFYVGGHATLE